MTRITMDQLNETVSLINLSVNQAVSGNYHISQANGGYSLHRVASNEWGDMHDDVFSCGHIPKRDLYNRMWAFYCGTCVSRRADA